MITSDNIDYIKLAVFSLRTFLSQQDQESDINCLFEQQLVKIFPELIIKYEDASLHVKNIIIV